MDFRSPAHFRLLLLYALRGTITQLPVCPTSGRYKTNRHKGLSSLSFLLWLAAVSASSCTPSDTGSGLDPVGIILHIKNEQLETPLELVAGQEYRFDKITLEVEERNINDSQEALDWLMRHSSFNVLDWSGVREAPGYWRNYKAIRPSADLFSHRFQGAAWMREGNSLQLSLLDEQGSALGSSLQLSNNDFLNGLKQWDFDMIKAEFRYENFARHKDKSSAQVKRAVAKIVFAVQTNFSKRLTIPPAARSLKMVWDKRPEAAYTFPIQLIRNPLPYGLEIRAKIEPEKDLYLPGETLTATFSLWDRQGNILKLTDFVNNGITRLYVHLDGPRHDPTFYHEEWLNDFKGGRFAYHLRSPALGLGEPGRSLNTPLERAPLDPTGTQLITELHIPEELPEEAYGTFEIRASAGRVYGTQIAAELFIKPIQIGQREATRFESFGCKSCHIPETAMDVGLLIPPMQGTEKLNIDNFQACVMCHDNSRSGSRRLDKYLHLLHMNRDNFPAAKNDCAVCHLTVASIKKVSTEVCSNCHEGFHENNSPNYSQDQCQSCHADYSWGHIVPENGSQ